MRQASEVTAQNGTRGDAAEAGGVDGARRFFHDPEALAFLQREILPVLFAKKNAGNSLRIWVPTCGSGEETYSIAILVQEHLARGEVSLGVRIFSTDANPGNVHAARAAVYPAAIAGPVAAARLGRFFIEESGGYRVRQELRDRCIFARHDLARDPPFGLMDLIACRSLPAHLSAGLLPLFHRALSPGGFLLLSRSARDAAPTGLFRPVSVEHGIFRRSEAVARPARALQLVPLAFDRILLEHVVPPPAIPSTGAATNAELRAANEDLAAANEELQSTLDELQASEEALLSTNAELDRRVHEIDAARSVVSNLFVATDVAAVFLDGALGITHFTPAAAEIFHLIPGDTGRSVLDLALLARAGLAEEIEEVLRTGTPREREISLQAGNRWFIQTVRPKRAVDGAADGAVMTFTEVTALKRAEEARRESEEQYRRVVDLVPSLLWTADASGKITYANERWYAYTGRPRDVAPATLFVESLHPDDRDPFVQAWDAARERGARFEAEARRRAADGTYRWFLVRADPMRDGEGGVTGWFGGGTDVQDRKLALELEAADRRKNELLAALAHDLRNPLAAIQNAAFLLGRAASPEPGSTRIRAVIDRQVSRMTRMIEDLLDVSRISQGKVTLKAQPLDLGHLVYSVAEDDRSLLEAKGLLLEVLVPPHPVPVLGDDTRLSQVVGNLLHNAGKFTDAGGRIRVTLSLRSDDARAVLTVEDTGIGIEGDILPRIFDAFTQADGGRGRADGGLGLGLSLVKGLVELHGGSVRAESPGPGQGSKFSLDLPVAEARLTPGAPEETDAGAAPAPARAPGACPRRVLLVDDHPDVLEPMQILFELEGYEVATARTGREALAVARTFRPIVVLCDIGLPGMSGYEVARALRADPQLRSAYLIALTGFVRPEDVAQAVEAGFDRHVAKPVDPEEMERIARRWTSGGDA